MRTLVENCWYCWALVLGGCEIYGVVLVAKGTEYRPCGQMWTSRWERGLGLVVEPLRTPLSPYRQTSWTFGQLTADFVRSQDYLGYAWPASYQLWPQ